jgi:hypothetical protein
MAQFLAPPEFIETTKDTVVTKTPNPAYQTWQMQDQIILGTINSTISKNLLIHVTRCTTSRQAWTMLKMLFKSQSHSRKMNVHFQLSTLKKGSSSVADYYHRFQTLINTLASVGHPLTKVDQQGFLLSSLGSEYDPFITSVLTRADPLSIEQIYGHFLTHEMRLEQNQSSIDLSMAGANFTTCGYNQHGRGGRHLSSHGFNSSSGRSSSNNASRPYRGRGHFNSSARGSSFNHQANRPKCQICNRFGHIALDCYNRFNEAYSCESRD